MFSIVPMCYSICARVSLLWYLYATVSFFYAFTNSSYCFSLFAEQCVWSCGEPVDFTVIPVHHSDIQSWSFDTSSSTQACQSCVLPGVDAPSTIPPPPPPTPPLAPFPLAPPPLAPQSKQNCSTASLIDISQSIAFHGFCPAPDPIILHREDLQRNVYKEIGESHKEERE